MRKLMLIDVDLCHDCNNCFMACKDEHCENGSLSQPEQPKHGHRWMNILRRERGQYPIIDMAFLPMPCMQCNDAACVKAGGGALVKREDGIVAVDYEAARGCHAPVEVCPYGALYYNEEADCPQKCDFCLHLLEAGEKLPRCVEACPTGALDWREVDEAGYDALLAEGWQVYGPAQRPSVLYRNLGRYTQNFIGGSVIQNNDCLEGAGVTLERNGEVLATAVTNGFGDFKFDRLDPGDYTVTIRHESGEVRLNVALEDAKSLGIIQI